MEKAALRVSVHTLVESALLQGDLVPGASAERLLEGVRGHQSLQSIEMDGVRNEVPVSCTVESESVRLTIYGRIDRLYSLNTVEEIKTTTLPLAQQDDAQPLHWAQAFCYAHMLCAQEGLPQIDVRITYLSLSDGEITRFTRTMTRDALAARFEGYVQPYLAHADELTLHRKTIAAQMQALQFPFGAYRPGQRELAAEIYLAIKNKRMLLAQAPTGTGKTMAALFPALKGIGQGLVERIFYLTARSTTREAALKAYDLLPENSVRILTLYAREKCCIHGQPICRTELCPRAVGYYDRLPEALSAAKARFCRFDRGTVRALADEFSLCPFEFSLDLALECDILVCDYNYVFDPRVRLQRFAGGGRQGQVLLIDEAHNLPDRARGMYSACLTMKEIEQCRKSIPKSNRRGELARALLALKREIVNKTDSLALPCAEKELYTPLVERCETVLCALREESGADPTAASQLALNLAGFIYHASQYDETDVLLYQGGKTTRTVTLFCTDAAARLSTVLKKSRSAVLFSATLTPMTFYRTLCGVKEGSPCVHLLSPFPPEHLMVLHKSLSTRYTARQSTLPAVASAILSLLQGRENGNFIAFFPSYAYMAQAAAILEAQLPNQTMLLRQTPEMGDDDREDFLSRFSPDPKGRLLALCVLGSVFSEGIDLPAERLCGAAVVGIGLPQLGLERDTLKNRYEEAYGDGFAYAYTYPGIGKVLQAAGRIIRTEHDRGVLLLLDDRYGRKEIQTLLPPQWTVRRVYSDAEILALAQAHFAQSSTR